MPAFVIPVNDIDDTGRDHEFGLPDDWLKSVLEPTGLERDPSGTEGALQVHVQRNGKELLLTGELRVGLRGPCVRCLEPATEQVVVPLTVLLSEAPGRVRRGEGVVKLSEDEPDRGIYSGDTLVLDEMVAEHLLVECPMQPLCSADCKGLEVPAHIRPPADFGNEAKEGIDPRLSPLLKLKDKVLPNKE